MNRAPKRLIVMAGGTGGHVFPGLAVAQYLIARGWQVRWLGTANRIEANLVPRYGIEIDFISISGLQGKSLKDKLRVPLSICQAVLQARLIMQRVQPDVALGMGGYVSGPGVLAAWMCGIPVVLHEQNSIAGLTNCWLAHIAQTVLQAFPGALRNAKVVGNPLRRDVLAVPLPRERLKGREGPIRVLVMGGSQGSQVLNQVIPKIAVRLGDSIILWHQVGKGSLEKGVRNYKRIGQTQHKVTDFINDVAVAYAWADVVVCRSGALTVSEVTAVGLPAIFIPFQHLDRQQYWNAFPLEEVGAAKIIDQSQFNADTVCEVLASWHRPMLVEMSEKAHSLAMPGATERVAIELMKAATQMHA